MRILTLLIPLLLAPVPAAAAQAPRAAQQPGAAPLAPVRQRDIDRALELGSAWLLEHAASVPRQGERCLMYYAAIQGGCDKSDPLMQDYALALRQQQFTATYDTACAICFLVALDPVEHMSTIQRAAESLASMQNPSGGWGYPSGEDLSNTQYGALGLWKASTVGVHVEPRVWERLTKRVREYQTKQGGFGYKAKGGNSVTMTTAGVGTLAACEAALIRLQRATATDARLLGSARERGLEWLEDQVPPEEARMRGWNHYALYGLERLGAWTGHARLGPHDWYQRGADAIVPRQTPEGSWSGHTDTAFAVLFLSRATSEDRQGIAVTSGGDHDAKEFAVAISSVSPLARLRVEGNGPSIRFGIENWVWPKLQPYEWPGERGRGPRIRYVEHLVNGEVVRVQLADPRRPMLNQRFRTTVWAPRRGPMQLSMRIHLDLPPKAPKDAEGKRLSDVLELGPVEMVAIRSLPQRETSVEASLDDARLAMASASAGASSRLSVGSTKPKASHAPAQAIDGDLKTAWLARPADKRRTWNLRIPRGLDCAELVLHPATEGGKLGKLAQVKLVEVLINREQRQVVVMPGDGRPGRLNFAESIQIEALQLRVISLQNRDDTQGKPFGFAEVEFLLSGS